MINYKRTVTCSICSKEHTEKSMGEGFHGWGAIAGVELNGQENPALCPEHLKTVMDFVDKLAEGE